MDKSVEEHPVRRNRVFELPESELEGKVHQEGTRGGLGTPRNLFQHPSRPFVISNLSKNGGLAL